MGRYVFSLRNATGLQRALRDLHRMTPTEGLEDATLTATNAALVATTLAIAALWRTESRGAHRRSDRPGQNPSFQLHTDLRLVGGRPTIITRSQERSIA